MQLVLVMQIKPLAFTLLFFGVLAFGADFWLSRSATQPFFEQSQLISAPASDAFPEAAAASAPIERPELDWLDRANSADTTKQTVAEKLHDVTLATRIKKKLFDVKELHRYSFSVQATAGEVTIAGKVDTEQKRQLALRITKRVAGVSTVVNNVEVGTL